MFAYEWTCRWNHVDPAEHAYFPRLVDAMHEAGDAFFEAVGAPYWDHPTDFGVRLPIVETGQQFERSVVAGDRITIEVETDLGNSSLRFEFTGRTEDGEVAFTGFEQHVCVPTGGNEATTLPDDLREAVEAAMDDG